MTYSTDDIAIYVHWPWCKAKCPYCDFNSHVGVAREGDYVAALEKELGLWAGRLSPFRQGGDQPAKNGGKAAITGNRAATGGNPLPGRDATYDRGARRRVASVFFGGGTPSLMAPESIGRILQKCSEIGQIDAQTEITVECNPTSFDEARPAAAMFAGLRSAGVNRISVGIQGLRQEWLGFLGRSHTVEEALATLDAAQATFGNVNADVIYGLPGQDLDAWAQQLEKLAQRGLAHISAYQLTVEKNTRFYRDVKEGLWVPVDSDTEADFFDATRAVLGGFAYENYEISNFAKDGYACAHNRHVWRYGDYLGVGAGAHGRVTLDGTTVATTVVRQPEGYLARMEGEGGAWAGVERVEAPLAVQETFLLGLRLKEGVNPDGIKKRFGSDAYQQAIDPVEQATLTRLGLLEEAEGWLRLSDSGWSRLNPVLERLLRRLPEPPAPTFPLGERPRTCIL